MCLVLVLAGCSDEAGGDGTDGGGNADGGGVDGGDAGDDGGGPLPPTGEELTISFVTETRAPNPGDPIEYRLWVTDEDCEQWPQNSTCDATEVTGGALTCEVECRVTSSLDAVIWQTTTQDVMIAALNGDLTVAGDERVLAQSVETWSLGPETMVFSRSGSIFAVDFEAGAQERNLGSITSRDGRNRPGGYHYAPHIDAVIANIPTSLSAMDLVEIPLNNPGQQTLLYHFVSDVEQVTGSYYGGQQRIAVSPDGDYVAIVTDALDTTNACDPNAQQTTCDPEYRCSSNSNRCIGEQLLLHMINRRQAGLLSVPGNLNACSADAECGEHHQCDMSFPDASNMGVCTPGKLVLGYWRDPCAQTSDGTPFLDDGEYEDVLTDPVWRSDGRLMFVGVNSCGSQDIDVTNLVAIDPGLTSPDLVVENPGLNNGGGECFDDIEQVYTPEGCAVQIARLTASPSGQTAAFIASSVRSANDTEVWLIDAWGRGGKTDLTRDILTEIRGVQVLE